MDNSKEFVKILADLKFIASVKKGDIMYIADRTVAQRTTFSTLYRKYYMKGESGQDTADFISRTLSNTYKLIRRYREIEGSEKHIDHLIEHINYVKQAIDDLKTTYKKHPYIDACFDAIKIDIDRSLEIYNANN